ncbi:MAG: response regulator transcription factor [Saprospiraceae bacterium]|nr:response regulator transcription factor [Saprospiraceae bacterium]
MKIVIVEDEPAAVRRLSDMIIDIEPNAEIIHTMDSVMESIDYFSKNDDYELIFMDIHLADGNSFEIFKATEIHKPIIFSTAYNQYALDAFKMYTIDYLLKPIKKEQLEAVFIKYKQFYKKELPDMKKIAFKLDQNKRFLIRLGNKIIALPYSEVAYYFTGNKITYAVTFEGKRYPLDQTMEFIESEIISSEYFRVNRQYIVHRDAILTMTGTTKSRVCLNLVHLKEEEIIVSVERSPNFKIWIKK